MNKRIMSTLLALCLLLTLSMGAVAEDAALPLNLLETGVQGGAIPDSLVRFADGSLLLCGFVYVDPDAPDAYSPYMACFDEAGLLLWERTPTDLEGVLLCHALGLLADGRAAVLVRYSEDSTDWAIELIGADGGTDESLAPNEGGTGALTLLSRGFLEGGVAIMTSLWSQPMGAEDGLSLLDFTLTPEWAQFYEGLEGAMLTQVDEAGDGAILGGYHQTFEGTTHSSKATVVKVGWDGGLLWRYEGASGIGAPLVGGVQALSDGGALFTFEADPTVRSRMNAQGTLTRLDAEGAVVFAKGFGTEEEPLNLSDMAPLDDAYVILATTAEGSQRLLRVSADGDLLGSQDLTAPEGYTLGVMRLCEGADGSVWVFGAVVPKAEEGGAELTTLDCRMVFAQVD